MIWPWLCLCVMMVGGRETERGLTCSLGWDSLLSIRNQYQNLLHMTSQLLTFKSGELHFSFYIVLKYSETLCFNIITLNYSAFHRRHACCLFVCYVLSVVCLVCCSVFVLPQHTFLERWDWERRSDDCDRSVGELSTRARRAPPSGMTLPEWVWTPTMAATAMDRSIWTRAPVATYSRHFPTTEQQYNCSGPIYTIIFRLPHLTTTHQSFIFSAPMGA